MNRNEQHHNSNRAYIGQAVIGIDVGSITVKAVVVDPQTNDVLWRQYHRHYSKQIDKTLELLTSIHQEFPGLSNSDLRVFITGSGGGVIAEPIGAKYLHEVNAVTIAVEKFHPDVGSVIELGGQDAKLILFRVNHAGDKQVMTFMNDKCASGTGVVIDKCLVRAGMPPDQATVLHFDATKLHRVAAKCGIFAETDIVSLTKTGIPANEIMCSLADAIVYQNLTVLTRGHTLGHKVLLLGGPNTYFPFLQECWRKRIPEVWVERGYDYPQDVPVEELIFAPNDSQYYAAIGAVIYGRQDSRTAGAYNGLSELNKFASQDRKARLGQQAGPPLVRNQEELESFRRSHSIPPFKPATFKRGQTVRGVIGLDGGSTSSKAVLLGEHQEVLFKAYQLSKGNPLQDTKDLLQQIQNHIVSQGATLEVLGFGVTGYAGDILEKSLKADVNIVETIAHLKSALHYFDDVHVICDVGGQDIKVLFMKNGDIRNFRLSNQCSAGNGMLLQTMAQQFNIPIEKYAETAFKATLSPIFSYGCGVFLDADRVTFQKEGFTKEELLAGLALVLPKNIWQYVAQIPRLAALGDKFVLQGGTQHNLAAVKAQVDYIKERVPQAQVFVHPHTGEAGAIGVALETLRIVKKRGHSAFVGLNNVLQLDYATRSDESTRCTFCANHCNRTFIDINIPNGELTRYISGFNCEKGTVASNAGVIQINKERLDKKKRFSNLVEYESRRLFQHFYQPEPLPNFVQQIGTSLAENRFSWGSKLWDFKKNRTPSFKRSSIADQTYRQQLRIGIPRALAIWSTAPFWRTYLETLDVQPKNIIFSDYTSESLWRQGGKYGSIDPCFPAKIALAHVHNLLFQWHDRSRLDYILFPSVTHLPSPILKTMDVNTCSIVAGTPNVAKAAFRKEKDLFMERGVVYLDPIVTFAERPLMKKQLFEAFKDALRITEDESNFAVDEGWVAMQLFDDDLEEKGKIVLEQMEYENKLALLMIGRPYHDDPHLHLKVLEEFQMLGYPVLSIRSIPKDEAWLRRFFEEDIQSGRVNSALEVGDVWQESFTANSVQKVWAAKFAARHPNVAVIDLSSFKCGHDAPTYAIIDAIVSTSGIPYLPLHEIDANKARGSLQLRIKTFAHTLKTYEERLRGKVRREIEDPESLEQPS